MKYAAVKNAHVVPRSYLKHFAADDEKTIAARLREDPLRAITTSIDNVGTRRFFYRRTRPDGTVIDDTEWSLSQLEGKTAPLLQKLKSQWPLPFEEEVTLAHLFGYQVVRSPQWKDWHEDFTRKFVNEHRAETDNDDERKNLDDLEETLLSARARQVRMLSLGRKIAAILGSMHWTLVRFEQPYLVTSDQPVVMWPRDLPAAAPHAISADAGLMETLEIRVPLSSQHLLLMTWLDEPDDDERVIDGTKQHAAIANAFTVANCDRQWMHRPGTSPPIASGRLLPLSPELLRSQNYNVLASEHSRRRRKAIEIIEQMKDDPDLSSDDIAVVSIRRNP
jgi:hypothetical protein